MGYSPSKEDCEEKDRFWNNIHRVLDRVGNKYRLCILGGLNRWKGDRMRGGITGAFGIPEENGNGRRLVEFYAERGL